MNEWFCDLQELIWEFWKCYHTTPHTCINTFVVRLSRNVSETKICLQFSKQVWQRQWHHQRPQPMPKRLEDATIHTSVEVANQTHVDGTIWHKYTNINLTQFSNFQSCHIFSLTQLITDPMCMLRCRTLCYSLFAHC